MYHKAGPEDGGAAGGSLRPHECFKTGKKAGTAAARGCGLREPDAGIFIVL